MSHSIFPDHEQCVYPGEFVPLSKKGTSRHEINISKHDDIIKPPLNLIELPELLRIEMAIPGLKKEDFIIEISDHILKVFVEKTINNNENKSVDKIHEFSVERYGRNISLPGNADTTIVYAEYECGILKIHIPKSETPDKNNYTRVVVY